MSESFDIRSAKGSYRVTVGGSVGAGVYSGQAHPLVLADRSILSHLPPDLGPRMDILAEESAKSLENMASMVTQMRALHANRDSHLLAVGGGIIQDIATFVASIYMRGIPWTYYPTTLLGMVDSCIGGKSSINVGGYKNLIGNFYPPREVIVDVTFIKTLNPDQVVSGLCEAAKICYARGPDTFAAYLACSPGATLMPEQARQIITLSLKAKQWFIEIDEFDQKERLLLNFGHTFGHALESATKFAIPHGVAVGIGMLVAEDFAKSRSLLQAEGHGPTARLHGHIRQILQEANPVRAVLTKVNMEDLLTHFEADKKHSLTEYRVIVPVENGRLIRLPLGRNAENRHSVAAAFESVFQALA